jgi:hypothetical protein
VAPPASGDRLHHIARSSGPVSEGTIYVRRTGRSEPASSADIQKLSARLVAATDAGLDILVTADVGAGLPRCIWPINWTEQWIAAEREHLLRPLEEARRPKPAWPPALGPTLGNIRAAQEFFTEPEDRTPDQYEKQVNKYLTGCREALVGEEVQAARYASTPVVFRVQNCTTRNYEQLEVQVHIEGDVEAYESVDYPPSLHARTPSRPRLWGPKSRLPHDIGRYITTPSVPYVPGPRLPRPDITNGGSTTVTMVPLHLRPHTIEVIEDDLVLITTETAASALHATWTATATNVPGRAEGALEIPLSDEVLDLSGVLTHTEQSGRTMRPGRD